MHYFGISTNQFIPCYASVNTHTHILTQTCTPIPFEDRQPTGLKNTPDVCFLRGRSWQTKAPTPDPLTAVPEHPRAQWTSPPQPQNCSSSCSRKWECFSRRCWEQAWKGQSGECWVCPAGECSSWWAPAQRMSQPVNNGCLMPGQPGRSLRGETKFRLGIAQWLECRTRDGKGCGFES